MRQTNRPAKIPDNSEPCLPHSLRSVVECSWILDRIGASIEKWKLDFANMFSSVGSLETSE
jgi:hypothetical protein